MTMEHTKVTACRALAMLVAVPLEVWHFTQVIVTDVTLSGWPTVSPGLSGGVAGTVRMHACT